MKSTQEKQNNVYTIELYLIILHIFPILILSGQMQVFEIYNKPQKKGEKNDLQVEKKLPSNKHVTFESFPLETNYKEINFNKTAQMILL